MAFQTTPKNSISLHDAVSEIKQASDAANEGDGGRSPFFFFVGSGISYPSIPLAHDIQKHCEKVARDLGRSVESSGDKRNDDYSLWFKAAYPHRVLRQGYLSSLIKGAPITHANFRLAHLLGQSKVGNIVVTVNFDDLLTRALDLFGKPHLICDDPRTVERIDPEKPDIQVIHAHGSYWFYDCRNTSEEIVDRARSSEDTNLTMAALLDKILTYRSPLVIGYNGWESDVFMIALKRRLLTPLPFNLYWFCYHRKQVEQLPPWLTNHADVYFVTPEGTEEVKGETGKGSVVSSEPTLSATEVLDALIERLNVQAPPLTKDPLAFFAHRLQESLPPAEGDKRDDIYSFRSVFERVKRAHDIEMQNVEKVESLLESVRDALRRAQYDEATNHAKSIVIEDLTKEQLRELMTTLESAIQAMPEDSAVKIETCDLVLRYYDALSTKKVKDPSFDSLIMRTLNIKGNCYFSSKNYTKAIECYDDALTRFQSFKNPNRDNIITQTAILNNKGLSLRNLQQYKEAIDSHDVVLQGSFDTENNLLASNFVSALIFKGQCLVKLGSHKEAVEVFDKATESADRVKDLTPYAKNQLESSKTDQATAKAQCSLIGA